MPVEFGNVWIEAPPTPTPSVLAAGQASPLVAGCRGPPALTNSPANRSVKSLAGCEVSLLDHPPSPAAVADGSARDLVAAVLAYLGETRT